MKTEEPEAQGIAERLTEASRRFAQSATSAYASENWEVFCLHLATAVEQLLKAVLAGVHPSFIADPTGGFDSLLHLCGEGARAAKPEPLGALRTITTKESFTRVARVIDHYEEPGDGVKLLIEMRNSVVHAGDHANTQVEIVLADVARFVPQLLLARGLTPDQYWGDSMQMVTEHAQRRLTAIEASYERKLQAARDRLQILIDQMGEDSALEAYVASVTPDGLAEPFDAAPVKCPACGYEGLISGTADPVWEADWDVGDGIAYIAGAYLSRIRLLSPWFKCRVCGLSLAPSQLPFAGLDSFAITDREYDLSEATRFYERQEAEDFADY